MRTCAAAAMITTMRRRAAAAMITTMRTCAAAAMITATRRRAAAAMLTTTRGQCGCGHHHDHAHKASGEEAASGKTAVFLLEHLGCANCAAKMEAKIRALPGVADAAITFATRQLRLTADDPRPSCPGSRRSAPLWRRRFGW